MKNTTTIIIIVMIVLMSFVAFAADKVKTKEDKYFEDKGCTVVQEKFKDKTNDVNIKARVFKVDCKGKTWNVIVYKEKLK
jgi:hypothetical protein